LFTSVVGVAGGGTGPTPLKQTWGQQWPGLQTISHNVIIH
jgi:hypothetical protein